MGKLRKVLWVLVAGGLAVLALAAAGGAPFCPPHGCS